MANMTYKPNSPNMPDMAYFAYDQNVMTVVNKGVHQITVKKETTSPK